MQLALYRDKEDFLDICMYSQSIYCDYSSNLSLENSSVPSTPCSFFQERGWLNYDERFIDLISK